MAVRTWGTGRTAGAVGGSRRTPCWTARRRSRRPPSDGRPRACTVMYSRTAGSRSNSSRDRAGKTESSSGSPGTPSSMARWSAATGRACSGGAWPSRPRCRPARTTVACQSSASGTVRRRPSPKAGTGGRQRSRRGSGGGWVSSAAGRQTTASTKGRQVSPASRPIRAGRAGPVSSGGPSSISGSPVSSSTSMPSESATSCAAGSRSLWSPGASRTLARIAAGRAASRALRSSEGMSAVSAGPGTPTTIRGWEGSTGAA